MTDRFTIHGVTSEALRQHVLDRFTAAVNQHEDRVNSLIIHFEDVNGPKGGEDKLCKAIIALRGGGDVIVEERGSDAYAVVSLAADRVKQAVGRKLDRLVKHH